MDNGNFSILTTDRFSQPAGSNGAARATSEQGNPKFVKLYSWFRRLPGLSLPAKWVYLEIVYRIGKKPDAWPGYDCISKHTNLSHSTVRRAIAELVTTGWLIKVRQGPGQSNRYSMPDTNPGQNDPGQIDPGQNEQTTLVKLNTNPGQIEHIENYNHELDTGTRTKRARALKSNRIRFTEKDILAIYQAYPLKVAKQSALKAIKKSLVLIAKRQERDPVGWLLDRVQKYAGSPQGNPETQPQTPNPATWFNSGRHDDDERTWQNTWATGDDRGSTEFAEPVKSTPHIG